MNTGTRRVVVDIISCADPALKAEARKAGVLVTELPTRPDAEYPRVSLYGPRRKVNKLLKAWGYDEKGR